MKTSETLSKVSREWLLRITLIRVSGYSRSNLWVAVSICTGLDSTSSIQICRELGWNPCGTLAVWKKENL